MSGRRTALVALLVGVAVVGALLGRVLLLQRHDARAVSATVALDQGEGSQARSRQAETDVGRLVVAGPGSKRAALGAATEAVELVLSYDHRTLDRDVARAEQRLSGAQRERYLATMEALRGPAEAQRVRVVAEVVGASAVTATAHDVKALLFVDQTTRRDDADGPRVALDRVLVTLHRDRGAWLVTSLVAI